VSVCSAASGALAWTASIQPTAATLALAGIVAGPTSDVVVADTSGGTVFEQHRWNASGTSLGKHQDTVGTYVGPFWTSSLVIDAQNDLFYGMLRTGLVQGASTASELVFNRLAPAGTVVFSDVTSGTVPSTSPAPSVEFFFAGGDASGGLHGPLLMASPAVFSPGVYCYGATGTNLGASAVTFLGTLSSKDVVWPAPDAGLYLSHPLAATTTLGCGTLTVPAGGALVIAKLDGAGDCLWNKLLAVPTAAVLSSAFRFGANNSTGTCTGGACSLTVALAYSGTVNLGNGALTSTGKSSLAIGNYSSTGTLLWAKSFGGTGSLTLGSVDVNSTGTMIVTGGYTGTASIGGTTLPAGDDTFLAVFDPSGNVVWVKTVLVGQNGSLVAAASPCGLVLGTNSPTVNLGTGPLSTQMPSMPASIGVAALAL
jgi:hypothetical protein